MADYNVNMKQWNGTSFDNVLPLAYNAKQLGGQSLAEVKQWVQDNGLLLYTGQYTGTGTYGASHPTSVTFPFKPVLFFFPSELRTLFANTFSAGYKRIDADGHGTYVNIKKSADKQFMTKVDSALTGFLITIESDEWNAKNLHGQKSFWRN